MRIINHDIILSAGDLSGHIVCIHLTNLEIASVKGLIDTPAYRDPMLALLQERGLEFENEYLNKLKADGLRISLPGDSEDNSIQRTVNAMEQGFDLIYQASLAHENWQGRADFLIKVPKKSKFGDWSYEVLDSKLAKQTRTGTLLQLCLYSEMIAIVQETIPEFMHVITPENEFSKHSYRLDDFNAYYRLIKKRLIKSVESFSGEINTYPTPCSHCEICNWWQECDNQRRGDDHLSYVAGLSNFHSLEIMKWDINTLESFAKVSIPLKYKPTRGAVETYERLREQARVQLEARILNQPVYECLDLIEGQGFFKIPAPSDGDIFFDLESDPFAGTTGLEYLFGWIYSDTGDYEHLWALSPANEKKAFESFVQMIMNRWKAFPEMHIYHFTPYEPAALKRLMGKHATCENQIDQILRAGLFIDLHSVTKKALRAGIETYSLKELEKFHQFEREVELREAALQLRTIQKFIERKNVENIPTETSLTIQNYNKEDCISTKSLRNWLESLRTQIIEKGKTIPRPEISEGLASVALTEHQQRIRELYDQLLIDVPVDASERNNEQQAKWILANMLDWYRREKKALWWEYFRLCELSDEELLEEKAALSGLVFTGKRQPDKKSFIDLYSFPFQETDIRNGDELKSGNGDTLGKVISIDSDKCFIQIRKGPKTSDNHPTSVFKHTEISDQVKEDSIIRIGNWVANNGINADGLYRAGRDLLLNMAPRTSAEFNSEVEPQEKAVTWVNLLNNGVLPIQGPPGTGKSHTAAQMILSLIQAGKKVGITALSHKVIAGLMEKVINAANKNTISIRCMRKVTTPSDTPHAQITEENDNGKILAAISRGIINLLGGTSWLWAKEDMMHSVDYLFVDEAGQLSLIDTIAVSQSAFNLVLLGDPQQLKQPQQGSHPEGTEVSALEHILKEHKTIPVELGIFLDKTWRLHPKICSFISELFYESRLTSKDNLINQKVLGNRTINGAGLWFLPVKHEGNQNSSSEEVEVIQNIINELLAGNTSYTNGLNESKQLNESDIKIITPYNSQVNLLSQKLNSNIQIGTVDKFQGQEAPIVIFSMATSSPEDAPRGLEFLYSLNRLNVAVSRAKAAFILVGSPKLFEPDCNNVNQMKMANAFCRFLELCN